MLGLKLDIDTVFKSIKGKILILVNKDGSIIKANKLAQTLCYKKDIVLEGKKWDDTFYKLGLKYYTFSKLLKNISKPIHVEFKINGSTELFELQIDKIENDNKHKAN